MALNYDYLSTTTREIFIPKLIDNIYDSSALLKILLMDERVFLKGGRKVVEPIKYAKSTSRGAFSGYDTFDVTPQDNFTAAEFGWANYYANVSISGDDERKNMGEAAVLDLLAERVEDAEMTLKDLIADDLYTGTAAPSIIGLSSAIGTTTPYGGISTTDFSGWVSGTDGTSHTSANMKDSTNASYIINLLQNAVRNATHLGKKPNLIVVPLFIWDIYENVLQANARYPKNKRQEMIADGGFNVLDFRGIPVVGDEKIPGTAGYVLNTEFMKLRIHPEANFSFTGFKNPVNQDAKIGQVIVTMQLTVNNRRMHYSFSALPTS